MLWIWNSIFFVLVRLRAHDLFNTNMEIVSSRYSILQSNRNPQLTINGQLHKRVIAIHFKVKFFPLCSCHYGCAGSQLDHKCAYELFLSCLINMV